MRYFLTGFLLLALAVVTVAGFRGGLSRRPPLEVFPDMDRQAKLRPQSANEFYTDRFSSRFHAPNTVPRASAVKVAGQEVLPFEDHPLNTGMVAGTIILVALFLTGLITAFNLSLIHFFERLQSRWQSSRAQGSEEDDEDEYASVLNMGDEDADSDQETSLMETPIETVSQSEAADVSDLELENIRHIEFVGDEHESEKDEDDSEEEPVVIEKPQRKKKKTVHHRWVLPPVDLLDAGAAKIKGVKNEQNAFIIQKTLRHFGIDVELGEIQTGPTVTQYTFRPTAGIKLSRITALSNDLALALAAQSIRIEAPIPGKSLVGIEVPNQSSAMVRLKSVFLDPGFAKRDGHMALVLGQDVMGEYIVGDLRKMPHLLVAGATNSGKSVCVNTLLLSLLYQNSPDDLKLILVDPKRVELSLYNKIPHLLTDVIVENRKVVNVLRWAVSEMERRYRVLQETGSRDLSSYHQKFENGGKRVVVNVETNASSEEDLEKLPYIVIVIDEMADLIMAHGKDVEALIVRLAQMSRAVGIHLILATQRPSVEVLTGLIKANITTRIAFQVATQIDSRTILDQGGAEKLLGRGDMLYLATGSNQPKRLQGIFISEEEVKRVVDFLRKQKLEDGNEEELFEDITGPSTGASARTAHHSEAAYLDIDDESSGSGASEDDLYLEAKELVTQAGKASASLLQRRLRVGYSRAARILDLLENDGIVGPADGAKPREVYVSGGSSQGKSSGSDREDDDPSYEQEKRDKWQM